MLPQREWAFQSKLFRKLCQSPASETIIFVLTIDVFMKFQKYRIEDYFKNLDDLFSLIDRARSINLTLSEEIK